MEAASAFAVREAVSRAVTEIKVSLLGDSSVGKTSITSAFINKPYDPYAKSTVCCEMASKYETFSNGDIVRFTIYDTAGQERFKSVMPNYVRNMDAVVLVYDITCKESYQHLDQWLRFVTNYLPCNVPVIIVGNKIDKEDEREVTKEEGRLKAERSNSYFIEASAKTGERVKTVFEHLAVAIRERKMNELFNGARTPLSAMAIQLSTHKDSSDMKRPCCGS